MTSPMPTSPLSAVKLALMAKRMREQAGALLRADPIAIVGIGCRVPGGGDTPERFWQMLREGINAVAGIPADRWDGDAWFDADGAAPGKSVTRRAAFLQQIDGFDAGYFGIPRREAERMDPQQRLFLEVAIEAIDDAGLRHGALAGSRTGVYVASYHNDYTHLQYSDVEEIDLRTLTGTLHSVLANRLSYHLDLRGPSLSLDTACSSSLVAVHLACQSLRAGETDIALAGGVSVIVAPELMVSMSKVGFMAPDGQCKTFDAAADGFGRGEGCGVIVLKRLSDAIADEDRVLAVIRGSAVNQDGHSTILTAPHGPAQEDLIRQALSSAMLEPGRIGFVETHGTGTALGDPIEVEAIAAALGRADAPPCFLGSAKANVGHLEAAAGVTGLIKAVLALRHAAIPPQANFTKLNPHIALDGTRLRVPTALEPWPAGTLPRCAAVSSFGVGGTNAHVIIEEAPRLAEPAEPAADEAVQILPLSAQTPDALRDLSSAWLDVLAQAQDTPADLCFTAAQRRTHYRCRTAVVGRGAADLRSRLADDLQRRAQDEAAPAVAGAAAAPKVGFVFSGQGPQWFAMGRQLLAEDSVFRDSMAAIDALLTPLSGWSLLDELALPEERSRLDQTVVAQPALFAIQVSLAALLKSWGVTPDMIAGHSVGEIAALHVAGVLDLAEAVRVVWHRGRIMQDVTGGGRMAALATSEADGAALIAPYGERLSIAAVNAPQSIVLSGEADALDLALTAATARGIGHRRLDVQYAFHSAQMAPMQERLAATLATVRAAAPGVAFYSTVAGKPFTDAPVDAAYFGRNVRQSVRFADAIEAMAAGGCDVFVEIGPHPVLGAAITECLAARGAPRPVLATLRRGRPEREMLLQCCAGLYAAGCDLDWAAVQHGKEHTKRQLVTLPAYPWQRQRYWLRARPTLQPLAAPALHPLLATHVVAASGDLHIFEGNSATARAWLADHRVFGRLPLPAAAVIDGFAFAAQTVRGDAPVALRHFAIHRPLFVPDDDNAPVRWQVTARLHEDTVALTWHEAVTAADGSTSWRLIADAEACAAEPMIPLQTVSAGPSCAAGEIYARFDALGVAFGPSFRTLDAVAVAQDAAQATVNLPELLDTQGHLLHPVLLDALLQLCSVAATADGLPADVYLPLAAERVVIAAGPHRRLLARVRIRSASADAIVVDGSLETPQGECVARIEGMRFARADAFAQSTPSRDLYTVAWQRADALPADGKQQLAGDWLLYADDGWVADALAARIDAGGGHARLVRPGRELANRARRSWTVDAAEPDHARRLLADIGWQGGHIVHCWSLDAAPFGAETPRAAARDDALGLASLLHLVQALARHQAAGETRLTILTRGVEAVADEPASRLRPRAAGAFGLASVIAREHPELNVRVIDLDPVKDMAAEQLLLELGARGPARLALRDGARFVPRLRRLDGGADETARPPMQLAVVRPGSFDGVEWRAAVRAPLPADAVRLSVVAAGLNFRDVLIPLGLYPEPMALGAECAGVVSEVGSAVTALRVGERVFGFVPGGMASDVVVPAAFLAPIPDGLGFEDAAGIAVAFLTAWHGLHDLAKLARGERVLIHAAAGGVGLAAVQLAQRCGAEIFATAGSPEKRDMLRGLGVPHVYDSRSLDFADAILADTGGRGVDVVLNSLADDFIGASLRTLAQGGRFLELGKRGILTPEAMRAARPDVRYEPYDLGGKALADRTLLRPMLDAIVAGLRDGSLRPLPVTIYPIEEAREAMRCMAQARHTGKIVLRIAPDAQAVMGGDAARVRPDASYWITGGLGALGLSTAEWLVRRGARYLVLTGRQPPGAPAADRIAALATQGVSIRVVQADVADRVAMTAIRDQLREDMPPLAGVVHAAGVLRDAVLVNQNWDDGQAVLRGKAHGAWLLHELTRDAPLDFFILYSAAGVLLGAPGQGLYSAANAQLDALAKARRAAGLPALSVAWGAWAGAGMASDDVAHDVWSGRGLRKIVPASGFAGLESLLASGAAYGAVLPIDWSRFMASLPESADRNFFSDVASIAPVTSPPVAPQASTRHDSALTRIRALPESQRRHDVLVQVSEQVRLLIGAAPGTAFDPRHPLKEIGVDSLMAVELRNLLVRGFGKPLSATLVFDHPTLDALATHLMNAWELTAPQRDDDAPAVDVADIAHLSPEAAEALLLRELELSGAGRSG